MTLLVVLALVVGTAVLGVVVYTLVKSKTPDPAPPTGSVADVVADAKSDRDDHDGDPTRGPDVTR